MSQAPHEPTDQSRKMASTLSGLGIPQENICTILGVSKVTLHKYYRDDLDRGMAEANAAVAKSLFNQATTGKNVGAAIFWLKARAGWTEKSQFEVTGKDGEPLNAGVVDTATALAFLLRKGVAAKAEKS